MLNVSSFFPLVLLKDFRIIAKRLYPMVLMLASPIRYRLWQSLTPHHTPQPWQWQGSPIYSSEFIQVLSRTVGYSAGGFHRRRRIPLHPISPLIRKLAEAQASEEFSLMSSVEEFKMCYDVIMLGKNAYCKFCISGILYPAQIAFLPSLHDFFLIAKNICLNSFLLKEKEKKRSANLDENISMQLSDRKSF